MLKFHRTAALFLALTAATASHADVVRLSFTTQVNLNGGAGFNQPFFLNEFGVSSSNGIAVSGHVDIDRAVLPLSALPGQAVFEDAIRAVQLTIGNKTLGFRDNPAVSGGIVEISNSPGEGWDRIRLLTPSLNGLAARPSNEAPLPGNPAHSYVFDWAPGSTPLGVYFGLSNLNLSLEEYNMLASTDLSGPLSQPLPTISRSSLNFELVMGSSPTAGFFATTNQRYYGASSTGFAVGSTVLPPTTGTPSGVPEPASLALVALGLLAMVTRTASSRSPRPTPPAPRS
ncbi:hypothetical protein IP87_15485 [beta proteobacterium AAP121]|nr:hypothetical protein IP80_05745 [beta proteobacterium AAP65]KPF95935.1 hypothetical protein IP87_15485 [beta proteobacterium AAP121]